MKDPDNRQLVIKRYVQLSEIYERYNTRFSEWHSSLKAEEANAALIQFEKTKTNKEFDRRITEWLSSTTQMKDDDAMQKGECNDTMQEGMCDNKSVSEGSRRSSAKSHTSSFLSVKVKEAKAKRALAKLKQEHLEKKLALEEERRKIEQQMAKIEVEREVAEAEAELQVWQDDESQPVKENGTEVALGTQVVRDQVTEPVKGRSELPANVMKTQFVFLTIFGQSFLHSALGVINRDCSCITPQYLEYGKEGTIYCNFTGDIDVIHWYNTSDALHHPPVISWNKKSEGGMKYVRGRYAIQPDGSLVMNYRVWNGDEYFKVVILSNEEIVCEQVIHVISLVEPSHISYPAIDKCGSKRYCHKRFDSDGPLQLSCRLNGTGVSKPILWELWTSGQPRSMEPAGNNLFGKSVGDETNVGVILPFTGQLLDVLVCKIKETLAYEMESSIILVEWTRIHSIAEYATMEPTYLTTELKSTIRLECGEGERVSFIWKICPSEKTYDCVEIVHVALENKVISEEGFNVDKLGALFVEEVKPFHEGWYWCISSDGKNNTERFYRVDVYAIPVPPKPIVDRCNEENPCKLESGLKGNITCSLFGVRPEATLEWALISLRSSHLISFIREEQTVIFHDDVYDISIKTIYIVESAQYPEIELECRANFNVSIHAIMSSLSTRVQLHLLGKLMVWRYSSRYSESRGGRILIRSQRKYNFSRQESHILKNNRVAILAARQKLNT
ncbi:hypothetical protein HOLleu_25010 [Holothuria leucospilota]|uniref:Ig-like domain-containing protein n=1 Tax=Holothuria leucospilota TaxID=206669 RepID=A0A9Q1H3P0_HOLLE|nr:hypothetical protein HOLleu_25010 [Holothuria leucospilota]